MKFAKALGLFVCSAAIVGCSSMRPVTPTERYYDSPQLGEIIEVELGNTLIDNGMIRSYPAIEIAEPAIASWGIGGTFRVNPGNLVAMAVSDYGTYYRSLSPVVMDNPLGGSGFTEGGIYISFNSQWQPDIFAMVNGQQRHSMPIKNFSYRDTVSNEYLPGSFRQEFIYNGKSGDTLKFLYRELKDSYLRTPFTQEVSYDIKEGNPIGFKGARLEVIEATNYKIKYKLIKKFD